MLSQYRSSKHFRFELTGGGLLLNGILLIPLPLPLSVYLSLPFDKTPQKIILQPQWALQSSSLSTASLLWRTDAFYYFYYLHLWRPLHYSGTSPHLARINDSATGCIVWLMGEIIFFIQFAKPTPQDNPSLTWSDRDCPLLPVLISDDSPILTMCLHYASFFFEILSIWTYDQKCIIPRMPYIHV
jgi:hypothetical protein